MNDDDSPRIILLNPPVYSSDRPDMGADIANSIAPFLNDLRAALKNRHPNFSHFHAQLQYNRGGNQFLLKADLIWKEESRDLGK
jgi:hypothetical protein